jgi:hypothetical protein
MSVEGLEDRQLLSTITVNTTAEVAATDATLSLREAIEVSSGTLAVSSLSTQAQAQISGAVGNTNTIDFNIPKTDPGYNATTGVWTIAPNGALPAITTNAAIIDGYSQPGAAKNTLTQGDDARLVIALDGASHSPLNGLVVAQQGSKVLGLDIENFKYAGVLITAGGNVQVAGCFIGTDSMGEVAASAGNGVVIENSSNTIGGPDVGDRNLISGNLGDGVDVPYSAVNPLNITPTGNVVENNFIGLDATGTKALGNQRSGVEDHGSGNLYGGTAPGDRNVISGNADGGLTATGSVTVQGNYCGTDATGNVAIGNGSMAQGISDLALYTTTISTVISNNLVSGNGPGILVSTNADSSVFPPGSQSRASFTISDNLIGTNAAGTAALGNTEQGLELYFAQNATVVDNVISGNGSGVLVEAAQIPQNDIFQGNKIGTDKTGQVAIGNTNDGLDLSICSNVTVGGAGAGQGNVIAYNGGVGIDANQGAQLQFTENSIFDNAQGGIELTGGANNNLLPPVLTFTPTAASTGTLSGKFTGSPNASYVVQIFSNPAKPPLGHEQGKTFLQAVTVKTDGSGNGTFSVTELAGQYYTANVTDPSGGTSTFSKAVGSAALVASTTTVSSSLNPSTLGQPVTFTATVAAPSYAGTPTGTVTFIIDGQAQSPVTLALFGNSDQAQFTTGALSAGSHTVSASYSGDMHASGSTGSLSTQTVTAHDVHPTTTTLTSSLNPSTAGQPVTFTAIVSPNGAGESPAGSVTFTIDGVAQASVPLHVVRGMDEATFSLASLAKGTHTVAAAYSGDSSFAASAVVRPLVQTVKALALPGVDGPTIESVQRFGIHMQPTVLVVHFYDALDPTSAVNLSNYRITDPSGAPVRIKSAVFDAATNSVTLRPADRINLHHDYHFTVIGTGPGGVRNMQGTPLDGAETGSSGNNYTGTLTWRNVVLTPAEIKKYIHPTRSKPAGALNHRYLGRLR